MTSVHVLGNPTARGARDHLSRVIEAATRAGAEPEVIEATSPAAASSLARRAVADGATRLVCVGGDGVVRIGVDAVAGCATTLGIVPYGTGNDFARAVGLLDGDVDDHVRRALADPVPVDAIRTSHGWAASVATIGFSGDVTARANSLRWPRGQQRYTVATVLQVPQLRCLDLELSLDGERFDVDTTLLAIGNTAYFGGGMRICPDAVPDDGLLHIVVIGAVPRLKFLRVFPRVFGGRHVDHPAVAVHRARSVTITARSEPRVSRPGDVISDDLWADGDVLGPLPVTCEAVPGAVSIAGASW